MKQMRKCVPHFTSALIWNSIAIERKLAEKWHDHVA
jgi:hypothetical protein